MLRPVTIKDAEAVSDIYNYYVANTVVSFEERRVSVSEMEGRIQSITADYPWLVWEEQNAVLGYAYTNKFRERVCYRYTAEVSIYLKNGAEGKGIGSALLARLLEEAQQTNLHALTSGITLPNERSVAIHEKFGFTKVAHFKEVGFKFGRWLDVGYWELILKK